MTFCPVETHTFFTTSSSSEEAEEFCVDEYAVLCVEESAVLCVEESAVLFVEEALFFVLLLCSKEALSADFVLSEEPDLVIVALDVEPDEEVDVELTEVRLKEYDCVNVSIATLPLSVMPTVRLPDLTSVSFVTTFVSLFFPFCT